MNDAVVSLIVIVVFSIIGGFFAAAETALVTLRESQISRLANTRVGDEVLGLQHSPQTPIGFLPQFRSG